MSAPVRVWDLPTRVFHWSLVLLLIGAYATGEFGWLSMDWHFRFGYAILGLISFRVLWGFFGGEHARFARFLRGPRAVFAYLREGRPVAGHNPLGGWAVLLLLLVIAVQAITGLFASDDIFVFGPLSSLVSSATSSRMTDLHEFGETALLLLVALHLSAVIGYGVFKRRNLTRTMITGRASIDGASDARSAPVWRFWLLAMVSAGLVWAVVVLLPTL